MGLGDLNEARKAAERLIADEKTAADLKIIIHEADKAISSALRDPQLKSGSLREAFNIAASIVPIGTDIMNKRKIPKLTYVKLFNKRNEFEKMGARFERAVNENDPVVLGLLDSLTKNTTVQEATVRLAARNENVFQLKEDGKGGGSLKLDLIPGQSFTVPIEPEYFAQAQDIVARAKAKKNGPGV